MILAPVEENFVLVSYISQVQRQNPASVRMYFTGSARFILYSSKPPTDSCGYFCVQDCFVTVTSLC